MRPLFQEYEEYGTLQKREMCKNIMAIVCSCILRNLILHVGVDFTIFDKRAPKMRSKYIFYPVEIKRTSNLLSVMCVCNIKLFGLE